MSFSWRNLAKANAATLKEYGFGEYDSPDLTGERLWLIPLAMYDSIPNGITLETVSGRTIKFKRGQTSKDQRHGFLPYGIRR